MIESITIRKYTIADQEQLITILKNNIPQYFAVSEVDDYIEYLNNYIQDYFVATIDERIIAGAGINYDKEKQIAKISWDIIDSVYQKQRLGTLLFNHRMDVIARKNIKSIIVRTSQYAAGFYEKMGFKLLERHKDYWAKGFDMYKMIYSK